MKKKNIILSGFLVCILLLAMFMSDKNIVDLDSIKFKEEYESLNDKINEKTGSKYLKVSIDEKNPIKYAEYSDVKDIIKNGTGVIYFGFPECPWCRNAIPVLLESAQETGLDTIYYFNALSIRDKKHLDENEEIVVDDEGTKEYKELIEMLYDYVDVYEGLNDESIKRLYFPSVVFVKDGKIVGFHSGTVESQEDASIELNKTQKEELKKIYSDYMLEVLGSICQEDSNKC